MATLELIILQMKVDNELAMSVQVYFNPFAPGDFAEKRVLKLVEWFSCHCHAIKS